VSIFTYLPTGEELMQHDMAVLPLLREVAPCTPPPSEEEEEEEEEGAHQLAVGERPRLFTSFIVQGVDTLLALGAREEVGEAASRFLRTHAPAESLTRANYDFIVQELEAGLSWRRQRRAALRARVAGVRARGGSVRVVLGASVDETLHPEDSFGPLGGGWVPFSINDLLYILVHIYIYCHI
jgi:hypothetical protein